MQLIVHPNGQARCLYSETIDLAQLGRLVIRRGSYVEPDDRGHWRADLAPCAGPVLGPFGQRSEALAAEEHWLLEHWLAFAMLATGPLEAERIALAISA
jgi:hypothetical protein